jgi:hypothetical protein
MYATAQKSTSSRTPDIEDPSGAFGMREGLMSCDPLMLKLLRGAEVRPEPNSRVGYYSVSREKQQGRFRGRMASVKTNVSVLHGR